MSDAEHFETWLSPAQVAGFERISRMEVCRRMRPGDSHYLISKDRREADGQPGRLIYSGSMTYDAQIRLRNFRLSNITTSKAAESDSACPASGQVALFPELDRDKEAAACIPSQSERDVAFRRKRVGDLCLNHNWKAEGHASKGDFLRRLAEQNQTSVRTIQRLASLSKCGAPLKDFIKDRPGPEPGTGTVLDADMRSHLHTCWLQGLNPRQCCRSLVNYLEAKQKAPGCRVDHVYHIPSFATAARFLRSLSALDDAAREGPDALKAACGHIDRSYLDLASLERVENDECKLNLFSFDPRRPVNRRGEPWIHRYWLLTFYDARSMYPLVWSLCEGSEDELRRGITMEDELNLFVALVRGFGVPAAIHSDRGRFRGREWGGEPYQQRIDKEFAPVNGILQRVGELAGLPEGIRHNMPRIHNPRGSRLERFHGWVRDWFRGKPGWVGRNTIERKMTHGDQDAERHKLWCVGKLTPGERSPLLTRDEVFAEVNKMMDAWREHNSEGTDMNGLTPHAVFVQCSPPTGFRRISDDDLIFATAEHFENTHIEKGGIIELKDGARYSHPLLKGLAGRKREVVRLRHDRSYIFVLPAQKSEARIRADRRARVGMKDPDELAREMEFQNRLEKLAGEMVKPLDYGPGLPDPSPQTEAPKEPMVIHPSEFFAAQEAAPPTPEQEISEAEFRMEHDRYKKRKPMDFADLED